MGAWHRQVAQLRSAISEKKTRLWAYREIRSNLWGGEASG